MDFESETQFNRLGKRLRDDDSNGIGAGGWDDQPKHRKLAFRTPSSGQGADIFIQTQVDTQLPFSHSAQPNPHTPTLTPADSSSDSSNAEIRSPPLGPSVAVPSTVFTPADDDIEMAMDGDGYDVAPTTPQQEYGPYSPMISPKSQAPSRSGSREPKQGRLAPIMLGTPNQAQDLSTRVPTPIYGHFSTSAGENPVGSPQASQTPGGGSTGSPLPHHSRSNHYNIALYPHHHLQERKMPSPISENFVHDGTTAKGTAGGERRTARGPRRGLAQIQTQHEGLLGITADEDMAMSPASPTAPTAPVVMSRSPSVGQRRRSDAISGSPGDGGLAAVEMARQNSNQNGASTPTDQGVSHVGNGQRASFHMGYKADCKMCQDRVPGHFNHITHARA